MKRWPWRVIPGAVVAAALSLAACVAAKVELPAAPIPVRTLTAVKITAVPLDASDPSKTAIGAFRYAGGLQVQSTETARLHGLSDLVVSADGWDAAMVSDDGDAVDLQLLLSRDGGLVGLSNFDLRPLTGLDSQPLQGKTWGDAEGLAILPSGDRLVSFEREHRIWRYRADDARATPVNMPPVAMAENDGMEGLAAAPAVAADAYWVGVEPGGIWLCRLSAACKAVEGLPTPPLGFRLSSLTTGPNGELVILHHSYTPGVGSRIVVTVVSDPLGAKRVIGGFAMAPSPLTDNFEGVAVVAKPNGDWRLYLLSDDNFSASQRTLLIAFDWTPPR